MNGNTVNASDHWTEIEVWGQGTVTYVGNYMEWTGSINTMEKYYYAGSNRVAVRRGANSLYWLLGDHLGSQAITTDANGSKISEVRYYPWGGDRYYAFTSSTTFRFTCQRTEFGLGLYYYGARYYDSYLNRWIQPDDIIPNPSNSQDLDRYAYVRNNPTRYVDPTGHWTEEELEEALGEDWRIKFFGKDGVFYERENLLKFLLSENTTDPITLEIVRSFFNVAHDAYSLGADFQSIDALGARVSLSYGGVGFISGTFDAILNITSGEFSLFGSPEGGIVLGATGTLVGGITLLKNLPSNSGYQGTAKAVGLMGGDVIGLNAEMFWGGVPQTSKFKRCF